MLIGDVCDCDAGSDVSASLSGLSMTCKFKHTGDFAQAMCTKGRKGRIRQRHLLQHKLSFRFVIGCLVSGGLVRTIRHEGAAHRSSMILKGLA